MLSYKPGAPFDPAGIRRILQSMEVGVMQFQITAQGRVEEQGGKRFFVAGKNRFAVAPGGNAPSAGSPVAIEAILNDRLNPMEVKILNFKPLRQ